MTFIRRNAHEPVLYILLKNYMFKFRRNMHEIFDLLNVRPDCMCIHHYLALGRPCIAQKAWSFQDYE